MAETALLRRPDGPLTWTRYTRAEIRSQWFLGQNKARSALTKGTFVRHDVPHRHAAEVLCALWLRRFCGYPDSHVYSESEGHVTFWLGYAADALQTAHQLHRLVLALELLDWQWDEQGRLFAEDGQFDVEVPRLVRALLSLRERVEEGPVRDEVDLALREAYVGG